MKCLIPFLATLLLACVCFAQTQSSKEGTTTPATKLEAFSAKTGVVIIRGYSEVGLVQGVVTVEAREFRDASDPKIRASGLLVSVREPGRLEREGASYVDYDEIDSLLRGIDYISKINGGVTTMKQFEAEYRTRGDFAVIVFNSHQDIKAAVSSGRIGKVQAFLNLTDLSQLRTLIVNGKAILDSAKDSPRN